MLYIGIDPGVTGAVALLPSEGQPLLFDTPAVKVKKGKKNRSMYDMGEMVTILRRAGHEALANAQAVKVIMETGIPMPGQSSFTTALVFEGIGIWKGIITALQMPLHTVTPPQWKRHFGLLKQDKNASILLAKRLYPTAEITLKKHHGRAEALLLAEYLRTTLDGRTA